jgi:hypothetical protein
VQNPPTGVLDVLLSQNLLLGRASCLSMMRNLLIILTGALLPSPLNRSPSLANFIGQLHWSTRTWYTAAPRNSKIKLLAGSGNAVAMPLARNTLSTV